MNINHDEIEGYLVGLILGDGHIEPKTQRIVISSNNLQFIDLIKSLLDSVNIEHSIFHDKSATVWKISIRSRESFEKFTKKYLIPTGNKTFVSNEPKLKSNQIDYFISGIYDAEGWFENDGKYFRIRIKMKSNTIMTFIKNILERKGFHPKKKIKDKCFTVDINKQNEVKIFLNKFALIHPKWLLVNKGSSSG